jgi:cytosine permease
MSWYRGIAPAYLNLFIWAPFFDQLWALELTRSGLGWLMADAILGSLFCFGIFLAAASWGLSSRKPLIVVACSTFGAAGSEWLCGLAIAFAGVVWYAIAVNFAIDSTFLGLRACRLLPASAALVWRAGRFECKGPVFLCTALFWIYFTRKAIMMRLPGVVVGLMKFYAPVALLLLTATAVWKFSLPPGRIPASTIATLENASARVPSLGHVSALSMIFGFFVMSGLLSIDWGAAVGSRRDIVRAGLPCVLAATAWTSIMSLLVVAKTATWVGTHGYPVGESRVDPMPLSFRWALFQGTGLYPAMVSAAILILFGLAALAPAIASLARFSETITTHWPRLSQGRATGIACTVAFILMSTFRVDHLAPVYHAMGIVFAPVLGALAGDLLGRNQGDVPIRKGVNAAGLIAWTAGCGVAVALLVTTQAQPVVFAEMGLESIAGCIVSACVFPMLASRQQKAAQLAQ